jgi:hypothetical protein
MEPVLQPATVSHDMTTLAWVSVKMVGDVGEAVFTLSYAPLADDNAVPKQIMLGGATNVRCDFASGDRVIVCELEDWTSRKTDVMAIEVASGQRRMIAQAKMGFAIAPDASAVALAGKRMTIAPLGGEGSPFELAHGGEPVAWIR